MFSSFISTVKRELSINSTINTTITLIVLLGTMFHSIGGIWLILFVLQLVSVYLAFRSVCGERVSVLTLLITIVGAWLCWYWLTFNSQGFMWVMLTCTGLMSVVWTIYFLGAADSVTNK